MESKPNGGFPMDYTQWPVILGGLFARLSQGITEYFPHIVGAVVLLAVGWAVAKLLRFMTRRLISQLNRLIPGQILGREIKSSRVDKMASDAVSMVVFWAVLLFFVAAATEALGLPVVTSGLSRLGGYLPTLLASVLVILAGLVLGNITQSLVTRTATSAHFRYAEGLGRASKTTVLLLGGLVALDQIGIDSTLLILVTATVIGMLLGGLALAFGVGARTMVSNILASHYLHQAFQVGQSIRLGEARGRIEEISPTHVVVESAEGRVWVPAKQFAETTSVLLREGSGQ
jgi:small-conductance mechanosensitive channel